MPSLILLASGAAMLAYVINYYLAFVRHLRAAKASGIRYVIVPVFFLKRFWLVTHPIWIKLLRRLPLPQTWTGWPLELCKPDWIWENKYHPFKEFGTDTFLTVSPGGICMWTADADVISQITTRRNDFPKPTHIYTSLDIYGKNVVSTEGAAWRHHRKSTSPPFTEKNNHLVWTETLDQAQSMVRSWVGKDGQGRQTVDRLMDDTMRLSLHVISRAGFGRHLEWPVDNEVVKEVKDGCVDTSKIKNIKDEADGGHSMSYTYALHCLLDNIILLIMTPKWMLQKLPFAILKKSNQAYEEFGKYMTEMVLKKKAELAKSTDLKNESMDIMGQLVKGQVLQKDAKNSIPPLTDSEVLGNAFVFILAGHETAANSIYFCIVYLALHLSSQRALQRDLDKVFQGRPIAQWDYERDLPGLFGGMTAAIMNEELRLAMPVVGIPKSTYGVPDQSITIKGKKCIVPAESYISLCAGAVHRNPNFWPTGPPSDPKKPVHPRSNIDNDLEEFKPDRWYLSEAELYLKADVKDEEKLDTEDLGVNLAADTSAKLYAPPKGAYIPFSEGYRACLGRRFAQVEVLAVLAAIFQNYSVELAVDKYATNEEVEMMDELRRRATWEKAADDARDLLLNGCFVIITLQMRRGTVPLRFVPRGTERFDFAA